MKLTPPKSPCRAAAQFNKSLEPTATAHSVLTMIARLIIIVPCLARLPWLWLSFLRWAGDVAKGFLAYFLGCLLLHGHISLVHLGGLAAGSAAIVGHSWPIYFGFRGGKGIWTSFAVALSFDWRIGVSLLIVFAIVLFFWRIVSLAAIVGAVLLPLFSVVFVGCRAATTIFWVLAVLAVYRHRANIKRILNGHEPKLGERNA